MYLSCLCVCVLPEEAMYLSCLCVCVSVLPEEAMYLGCESPEPLCKVVAWHLERQRCDKVLTLYIQSQTNRAVTSEISRGKFLEIHSNLFRNFWKFVK